MVSGQPDEQQTPGLNPVYSEACPPLSSQPGQCRGRSWWGQQRWPATNIPAEMSHKHPGRLPTQHTITCPAKASAHAPPILLLASNQGRGCSRGCGAVEAIPTRQGSFAGDEEQSGHCHCLSHPWPAQPQASSALQCKGWEGTNSPCGSSTWAGPCWHVNALEMSLLSLQ